jgi:hypothetical protein
MKSVWNAADRQEIQRRLAALRPDAPARWGKMDAARMVVHLTEALKMALGELPVAPRNLPIRYFPLKQLILYVLPFPKGAPTAPELVGRVPASWPAEVAQLQTLIERFASQPEGRAWPDHPAFGPLSRRAWGALVYKHTNHHLRQFGV